MNKHTPIHTRKQKHINYDNHTYLLRLQLSKNPLISTFFEFSIVFGGEKKCHQQPFKYYLGYM